MAPVPVINIDDGVMIISWIMTMIGRWWEQERLTNNFILKQDLDSLGTWMVTKRHAYILMLIYSVIHRWPSKYVTSGIMEADRVVVPSGEISSNNCILSNKWRHESFQAWRAWIGLGCAFSHIARNRTPSMKPTRSELYSSTIYECLCVLFASCSKWRKLVPWLGLEARMHRWGIGGVDLISEVLTDHQCTGKSSTNRGDHAPSPWRKPHNVNWRASFADIGSVLWRNQTSGTGFEYLKNEWMPSSRRSVIIRHVPVVP